jgi:hypothetical protein
LFNAKHGVKTGLSIGYRTVKDRMDGSVRHLLELALKEGSLTLFPANQQALVSAVKSEVDKHEQRLLEQRLLGLLAEARKAFEWKRRT